MKILNYLNLIFFLFFCSSYNFSGEVIRATEKEKKYQIKVIQNLHKSSKKDATKLLKQLQNAAVNNENIFESLMEVCKICSLGQITSALFEVGGQYRRNM